ncbi:MAG: hypothetical protein QW421_03170 [Archaeoglobaceae archaeon]
MLSKALEMMNEAGFELYDLLDRCRALVTRDFDFFREKIGMAIAIGGRRSGFWCKFEVL